MSAIHRPRWALQSTPQLLGLLRRSLRPRPATKFPGDTVTITVNLSESVTVSGTPSLALNTGGTASYVSGSGTNTLVFSYTVGTADTTVSALAVTKVNWPAGTSISDAGGNVANLAVR